MMPKPRKSNLQKVNKVDHCFDGNLEDDENNGLPTGIDSTSKKLSNMVTTGPL